MPTTAHYSPVQPNTVHYIPEQPSTAQYRPVQPSKAQYCPVQHSAVHYSPPPPVQVKVYHHVYISTLSRQSFAQKHPGLVHFIFTQIFSIQNEHETVGEVVPAVHVRHDLIDRILSLERYCLVFWQHGCYYCKSVGSSNHIIHMEWQKARILEMSKGLVI